MKREIRIFYFLLVLCTGCQFNPFLPTTASPESPNMLKMYFASGYNDSSSSARLTLVLDQPKNLNVMAIAVDMTSGTSYLTSPSDHISYFNDYTSLDVESKADSYISGERLYVLDENEFWTNSNGSSSAYTPVFMGAYYAVPPTKNEVVIHAMFYDLDGDLEATKKMTLYALNLSGKLSVPVYKTITYANIQVRFYCQAGGPDQTIEYMMKVGVNTYEAVFSPVEMAGTKYPDSLAQTWSIAGFSAHDFSLTHSTCNTNVEMTTTLSD